MMPLNASVNFVSILSKILAIPNNTGHGSIDLVVFSYWFLLYIHNKERGATVARPTCRGSAKSLSSQKRNDSPHAYMYYIPIVRQGFRQGAVRVCIYTTRRAHHNLMPDYLFWNLADFDKSNIKRRLRLNLMYQGIRTGSLPHCHQQFPSRHRAWSSTNCVQRYTKSPELPNNSGDFLIIQMKLYILLWFIRKHSNFLFIIL